MSSTCLESRSALTAGYSSSASSLCWASTLTKVGGATDGQGAQGFPPLAKTELYLHNRPSMSSTCLASRSALTAGYSSSASSLCWASTFTKVGGATDGQGAQGMQTPWVRLLMRTIKTPQLVGDMASPSTCPHLHWRCREKCSSCKIVTFTLACKTVLQLKDALTICFCCAHGVLSESVMTVWVREAAFTPLFWADVSMEVYHGWQCASSFCQSQPRLLHSCQHGSQTSHRRPAALVMWQPVDQVAKER